MLNTNGETKPGSLITASPWGSWDSQSAAENETHALSPKAQNGQMGDLALAIVIGDESVYSEIIRNHQKSSEIIRNHQKSTFRNSEPKMWDNALNNYHDWGWSSPPKMGMMPWDATMVSLNFSRIAVITIPISHEYHYSKPQTIVKCVFKDVNFRLSMMFPQVSSPYFHRCSNFSMAGGWL